MRAGCGIGTWIVRVVILWKFGHRLHHKDFTALSHEFVYPLEILLGELVTEMNHHQWVEWCFAGIAGKAKEKLHVSILSDLLHGLFIGQAKPLLDDQRAKRQSHRLRRGASSGTELRCISCFQLFPWHQRGEEQPAILRI